jgi:hypothetical protein
MIKKAVLIMRIGELIRVNLRNLWITKFLQMFDN